MIDPFMLGLPGAATPPATGSKAARSGRDFSDALAQAQAQALPLPSTPPIAGPALASPTPMPTPMPSPPPRVDGAPAQSPPLPAQSQAGDLIGQTMQRGWQDHDDRLPDGRQDRPLAHLPDGWETLTASASGAAVATHEVVELVSRPWHLQANAGLSYRSVSGEIVTALGLPPDMPVVDPIDAMPSPVARSVPNSGALVAAQESETSERFAASGNDHRIPPATLEQAEAYLAAHEASAGNGWTPMPQWPHRLMRWHHDDGAGGTAWVRDYSFDPADAFALIDALRRLAHQQGLSLRRVVLNGHELWRSSTSS